uniref:Cytochrome P450 n=1 Tax=Photinus pyralis TaxID=7054 RepID=A0A1Y1LC98_PHOPY
MWFVLIVLALGLYIYRKIFQPLQFWKVRNIPYEKPLPIVGNLLDSILKRKSLSEILTELYFKYSKHRYFGFFSFRTPTLMINDVDLAKQICIKDFEYFADHRIFIPKGIDKMWDKLIFIREGAEWQEHRKISSASFTLGKLRVMFSNLSKCAQRIMTSLHKNNKLVTGNMRPFIMKIANDFTLDAFMGIQCDSFNDPDNALLKVAVNTYLNPRMKGFLFFGTAYNTFPFLTKFFQWKFFPDTGRDFYRKIVRETLEYREKHNITRIDMLHLLNEGLLENLRENKKDPDNDEVQDEIVSQLMGMYFANFDSFTLTLCNCMYELALNPDIQERLIREIDETWANCEGNLPHDTLMGMTYMDMVYKELMRLRGNAILAERIVTKPYTIQPVLPHEKPVHLKVGQDITFPLYSYMRDPKFFPDPYKFDPERFNEENKHKIDNRAYLPFGEGPRKCIAFRLISVEIRLMLFHLLLRFRFVPTEKTVIPFVESKRHNILTSEHGYFINMEPRKDIDETYF